MRVTRNTRVGQVQPKERTSRASRDEQVGEIDQIRRIEDTINVLGVPAEEMTPKVRAAIKRLLEELLSLREELSATQNRVEELEQLADQDVLTPVANRRAFLRDLARMLSLSDRYSIPSSLVYFDVDNMKEINDKHGHSAGDKALMHVADTLSNNIRESDVVGRIGGDEFAVILVQTDEGQAATKAADLAQNVRDNAPVIEGKKVRISVSYGLYTFRKQEQPDEALATADRQMYEYKRKRGGKQGR